MNPSWMLTCDSFCKNKIDLGDFDPLLAFAHPHSFTKHSKLERRRRQVFDLQPSPLSTDTAIPAAGCIFPSHSVSNFQSVPCIHPFCSSSPRSSFWLSLPQFTPFLVICLIHSRVLQTLPFVQVLQREIHNSMGYLWLRLSSWQGLIKRMKNLLGHFRKKKKATLCLLPLF